VIAAVSEPPSFAFATVNVVPDPVPITQSLDSIMKSLRGTDRIQVGGVFGKWDVAVGPQIAAHVRPIKLDNATLLVEADTATWATQVKFLSETIMARLRDEAKVHIERVDVRVASQRRR
jgi:predicted nucleic acid-binding Zn ribbon protein